MIDPKYVRVKEGRDEEGRITFDLIFTMRTTTQASGLAMKCAKDLEPVKRELLREGFELLEMEVRMALGLGPRERKA